MRRRHRIRGRRSRRGSKPAASAPSSLDGATSASDLDRLVPESAVGEAALREPPSLIVEGPEGARRRRARDARDGVEVADPRRRMLYVGIAVFVAALVFAVLGLIESR
jgi:hypothetical protein